MKQPFFYFAMISILCSHLCSMEPIQNHDDDEILYLNIGGYKTDISRSTIEQFGGTYLNALISGKYAITKDREGRIFIDRPQEEGEIISYFTRCQQIYEKYDQKTIKNAAEFFGIELLMKYRNKKGKKKPKISEYRVFYNKCHKICCECGADISSMTVLMRKGHLLNHQAQIESVGLITNPYNGRHEEEYLYRVPLPSNNNQNNKQQ
jgi:hypothetical protein